MNFIITTLLMLCCIIAVVNCGDYIQVDGRTYYSSYPDSRNWFQAKRYCTYNGMYLVDVRTDAENTRIRSVINQIETKYKTSVQWWTSGTDRGSQKSFYWDTTGHAMLFMDWHLSQPDNYGGTDDCVYYSTKAFNYAWYDGNCGVGMYFICRDRLDIPTGPSNCVV